MSVCRWIVDELAGGAWNMAVDELLLREAADGGAATFRCYGWEEATLSLGYFQAVADRARHAPSQDCPAVRRRSGGGAILHHHELTYSLALPVSDRWSRAAGHLCRQLHHALIGAFRNWGVECNLAAAGDESRFLCFQRRAEGDILLQGHKIVGSAQRRHRAAVLQHGSILLRRSPFAPELPGLWDLCGRSVPAAELRAICAAAVERVWGWRLEPASWTARQLAEAARLQTEVFARPSWTCRR